MIRRQIQRAQRGFTLIELMIVVAIIGILAAIAIPQYQDYVSRARWSDNVTAIGQLKAAVGECLQMQQGNNNAAGGANCSDFTANGSLQTNGYLPANWAGPATPKYASLVPAGALSAGNSVVITITGNAQANSCVVTLIGAANSNQLTWNFVNAALPAGCNRSKTGVGS